MSADEADTSSAFRALVVPLALLLTLGAYAVLAVGYAVQTPIWQNPDEPAHFNYLRQVADTGTLPVLQSGDWDSQLLERLKNGRLEPGDSIASIRYEGWQPPLYYILAAPVFRAAEAQPVSQQVQAVRLFDALLGAATLIVAYFAAREVLPVTLALAVPVLMTGVPMFTSVSSAISTDALANLLAAVLLLVLLRSLRGPQLDWRRAAALGVLVALGVLAKLALAIFVPLALALVLGRSPRRIASALAFLVAGVLVGTPWLIHQVTSYGLMDPLATTRHSLVTDQPRFPGLSAGYLSAFATTSFHSFWAQFGWMAIVAPVRLYAAWGALCVLAVAGLLLHARKHFARARVQASWLLLGVSVAGAVLAYLGYNVTFQQPQGRYLFTALTPIAIFLVLGWAAWVPERLGGAIALLLSLALVALNAYALLRVLGPGFHISS